MFFVATAVGRSDGRARRHVLADSFVILALCGFLLSLLSLFGREGDAPPIGWGTRIAGIAVLIKGVLLVLGLLL